METSFQDNFKPVYFFYGRISRAQKNSQANINLQNKIKQTLNNQGNFLEGESRLFCVLLLFVRTKSFRKKINRLEIVLKTSLLYY